MLTVSTGIIVCFLLILFIFCFTRESLGLDLRIRTGVKLPNR